MVLVVESNESTARRVIAALNADEGGRPAARSLGDLVQLSLDDYDAVLCAASLCDGSGLDALAYVQGMRPDLPVILLGDAADAEIAVEAIRGGAVDFVLRSSDEFDALPLTIAKCVTMQHVRNQSERLQQDLSRLLADVAVKNHQLQLVVSKLETMARTDELTGLSNRRWLNIMLEGCWAEATRYDQPLGFMMIDLDGFKPVNDRLGHQLGDELLLLVGKVIRANCRATDVPSRYGGDEFSILMPNTSADDAMTVAHRVAREFELAVARLPFVTPLLGMSIGVSHVDLSRPINSEHLIRHADEALYAAKLSGKGRILVRHRDGIHPSRSTSNVA